MTRPGSRKPENGKQREGKKAGSLQRMPDAREIAADILMEVLEKKQYSHVVLLNALKKYQYLEKQERSFIKRVVDGTLERLMQIDFIIESFSSTPLRKMKPTVRTILRMGVYQICYMDRVPDSAACNEAVKLTVKRGFSGLKGFVNGVLRNIARNIEDIKYPVNEEKKLSVNYSMPEWIIKLWTQEYGINKTKEMLTSIYSDRRTTVRVNTGRVTVEEVISILENSGVKVEKSPLYDKALLIWDYDNLNSLEAFLKGMITVQDLSSMMAGLSANPKKGDYIIDVCAAPGGKTMHMADIMGQTGMVDSRDLTPYKISLINENISRMGYKNIKTTVMDATVLDEKSIEAADVVMADLPCSGLGVMGKKNDIKYNVSLAQIKELVKLQRQILQVSCKYLKKGGTLVFSTCTVNKYENDENVRWITENLPLTPVSLAGILPKQLGGDKGYVQIYPGEYGMDGFFVSAFKKI